MKTARMFAVCMMVVGVGLAASASPTLIYDGSFKLPSPEQAYTARTIAFAPAGTPRLGDPVQGPTVVIGWEARQEGYNDPVRIKEVTIPAVLAKTGTPPAGTYVGTAIERQPEIYGRGPYDVDSTGNFWGPNPGTGYVWCGNGLVSLPGQWKLGNTGDVGPVTVLETNWAGMGWCNNGMLRRGDGNGNLLPTDGTAVGATFITADDDGKIRQDVRGTATTFSSTSVLFAANINNPNPPGPDLHPGVRDLGWCVDYVRDTGHNEWFLVCWPGQMGPDATMSSKLYLFPGNSTGGGLVDYAAMFNIDPTITGGVGYSNGSYPAAGGIQDIAVDWDAGKLYVLDNGGYGVSYIHVFTLDGGQPPAPEGGGVPEPRALGLVLLGLPLLRRRRPVDRMVRGRETDRCA